MSKFWGLTVNVGKKFKQQVQESFCISGAALEPLDLPSGKYDEKPVLLYLQQDQNDFLLCSLSPKQSVLQTTLNVRIGSGETVGFHLKGGSPKSKVHLIGFTLPQDGESSPTKSEVQRKGILVTEPKSADKQKKRVSIVETEAYGEMEPLDSEDEVVIQDGAGGATKKLFNGVGDDSDEDEDDDEDDDEEDSDDEMDDAEYQELQQMLQRGRFNPQTGGKLEADEDSDELDLLGEEEEDDDDEDDDDEEDDSDDGEEESAPAQQKKKQNQQSLNSSKQTPEKQKQQGSAQNTPNNKEKKGELNNLNKTDPSKTPENKQLKKLVKTPSSAGHTPMKSFSKGGVLVNDVKTGNGQVAKTGKMVSVYYEGRLKSNNKRFDATQNGPGFKFRLGKGEVIKGWDLGIEGMKIGGKRRLVIPAQLAYGKRGAPPDIPPNSTLIFDVELKNVS